MLLVKETRHRLRLVVRRIPIATLPMRAAIEGLRCDRALFSIMFMMLWLTTEFSSAQSIGLSASGMQRLSSASSLGMALLAKGHSTGDML